MVTLAPELTAPRRILEQKKRENGCRLLNTGVEASNLSSKTTRLENKTDIFLIFSLQEV